MWSNSLFHIAVPDQGSTDNTLKFKTPPSISHRMLAYVALVSRGRRIDRIVALSDDRRVSTLFDPAFTVERTDMNSCSSNATAASFTVLSNVASCTEDPLRRRVVSKFYGSPIGLSETKQCDFPWSDTLVIPCMRVVVVETFRRLSVVVRTFRFPICSLLKRSNWLKCCLVQALSFVCRSDR